MKKIYLHVLVIAIIGLVAYSNSFNVPFHFDDLRIIPDNPYIKNLENFNFLKEHEYNPKDEYNPRRYLGYLSLALNYRYGGLDVTGYHIVNLLIHLINGILVYFFVILTFKTPYFLAKTQRAESKEQSVGNPSPYAPCAMPYARFIALFSALLFVAHPVQTQAVTYIVQRFTSLATLFYLLAVVMYVKGRLKSQSAESIEQSVKSTETDTKAMRYALGPIRLFRGPMPYALCSLLFALLAMKTKEIAFTLPIVILFYEFTFFKSTLKRKLVFLLPVLLTLLIIPMSVLHIDKPLGEVLSDLSEKSRLQTNMPRADYLMTEMRVIVTYIRLIVLPINQNLDYNYPIYRSFFSPPVFLSFLFLSALFWTALYLLFKTQRAKRTERGAECMEQSAQSIEQSVENYSPYDQRPRPYALCSLRLVSFGILWFLLALSVESSFIPIVDVIFEHRLYLPSIGAFVALSAALFAVATKAKNRWPGAEKALIPLVLIIVLMLSAATFARNRVWQNRARLWEDVVRKSPGNARAHNNLGVLYQVGNKNDQAVEQFLTALRLRPDYQDARVNLGIMYNTKGMFDQALIQFMMALSVDPDNADAHNNFGITYVSKGLIDEGIKHYQIALTLQPDYAEAYNNLGVAYGSKGLFDQARENFEHAIHLKPDYFEAYHNLALLYEKMGDYEKAAAMNSKARQLKPAS